jgi:hypothetical protein
MGLAMPPTEVETGQNDKPDPATRPNTGIGRITPDGCEGSCAACHARHDFSAGRLALSILAANATGARITRRLRFKMNQGTASLTEPMWTDEAQQFEMDRGRGLFRSPDQDGRVLYVHPLLRERPDLLPLAIAYMIPLINYGDIVSDDHCLLYGATLMGLFEEEFYARLCLMSDVVGAETRFTQQTSAACCG